MKTYMASGLGDPANGIWFAAACAVVLVFVIFALLVAPFEHHFSNYDKVATAHCERTLARLRDDPLAESMAEARVQRAMARLTPKQRAALTRRAGDRP